MFQSNTQVLEDIDLAANFEKLGFIYDRDPRQTNLSNTRRQRLLDEMQIACRNYIAGLFLKFLSAWIENVLGDTGWTLEISSNDPHTVNFVYPGATNSRLAYIHPHVVTYSGVIFPETAPVSYREQHFVSAELQFLYNWKGSSYLRSIV